MKVRPLLVLLSGIVSVSLAIAQGTPRPAQANVPAPAQQASLEQFDGGDMLLGLLAFATVHRLTHEEPEEEVPEEPSFLLPVAVLVGGAVLLSVEPSPEEESPPAPATPVGADTVAGPMLGEISLNAAK